MPEAFIEVVDAHPEGMRLHNRAEGHVEAPVRRRCVQARCKHVAFSQLCNLAVLVADKVGERLAIIHAVVLVRLKRASVILSLPSGCKGETRS